MMKKKIVVNFFLLNFNPILRLGFFGQSVTGGGWLRVTRAD